MPKSAKKQTSRQAIESALARLPAHRAGLPAKDAITAVTKGTGRYTVLHSRELDDTDRRQIRRAVAALAPAAPGAAAPTAAARAAAASAAAAVPAGDNYLGKSRKAAKLSISAAKPQSYKDLKDLVKSLVPDATMKAKKIPITPTSKRVREEDRNIHVSAFMYAASRESDNDFHLIIGRAQSATPEMYMTMELSGLPPAGSASLKPLKAARDAFKQFFKAKGLKLPVMTYDYYHPPVPVQIDGSLFFDMTHAKGPHPGPPSLKNKMPTIWEVHPISKIVLK